MPESIKDDAIKDAIIDAVEDAVEEIENKEKEAEQDEKISEAATVANIANDAAIHAEDMAESASEAASEAIAETKTIEQKFEELKSWTMQTMETMASSLAELRDSLTQSLPNETAVPPAEPEPEMTEPETMQAPHMDGEPTERQQRSAEENPEQGLVESVQEALEKQVILI